ncbi:MAG: protein kinase, partial [Actinobacteria bacterium]|nr:protein kinase [Actinomycetota bacterium]
MSAQADGDTSGVRPVGADSSRCAGCGGRVEVSWAACGWCGRPLDAAPVAVAPPAVVHDVEVAETAALPVGALLLGRYRIDTLLGRGGFGITYRARDTRLHRDVAIKELFPPRAHRRGSDVVAVEADQVTFEAARARFRREATALAHFSHPGIVRIFEVFDANETSYLVMELIDGSSVGDLLRERGTAFDVARVLDIMVRAGSALEAVHAAGMLHRDVNPSNLMVEASQRVVLIDFGLARRYGSDVSASMTRAVTPGYAPPEQYTGSNRSGPSSDVFGLAATAYKLVTGTTPTNALDRQAGAALPAPVALRDDVPPMISAAILDGMELDPEHRPATVRAFLDRLGLHGIADVRAAGPGVGVDPTSSAATMVAVAEPAPVLLPDAGRAVPEAWGPAVSSPGHALPEVWGSQPTMADPLPEPMPHGPGRAVGARSGHETPQPAGLASRTDGSPAVIGPPSRRRGWVTWPAGVAVIAAMSAAPVVVSVLVALVALPWLATLGDIEVHRHRRRSGQRQTRWHHAPMSVVAPVRFARNVVIGLLRALPAVALGAIGYAVTQGIVSTSGNPIAVETRDLVIRITGVAMGLVLVVPIRHTGRGFRADEGLSYWAG